MGEHLATHGYIAHPLNCDDATRVCGRAEQRWNFRLSRWRFSFHLEHDLDINHSYVIRLKEDTHFKSHDNQVVSVITPPELKKVRVCSSKLCLRVWHVRLLL